MPSSLDLSLPDAPPPRAKARLIDWLTLLGVILACGLIGYSHFRAEGDPATATTTGEAKRLETLARDLERRTLYEAADKVWEEYLEVAELTPAERGEVIYRRGKCLKEGGLYEEAARCFTEVENQSFGLPRETKLRARQYLLECLSGLGKSAAREVVARAFATRMTEDEVGTIVARVGGEPITREELHEELLDATHQALKLQGLPATATELEAAAREEVKKQLADPETAREILQRLLSRRVLYREGLERGYGKDKELAREVARFRRNRIANRVVEAEMEEALRNLGPTEISNHYEAHKERFVEKASVEFSYITFPTEAEAAAALDALAASPDADLPWQAGPGPAEAGAFVPGFGRSGQIAAHLFSLGEGEVSGRPIAHDGGYTIFRAEKKTPERQLELDEAEAMVRADWAKEKRQETLTSLQQYLSGKFAVEILDADLQLPEPTGEEKGEGGEQDGDQGNATPVDSKTADSKTDSKTADSKTGSSPGAAGGRPGEARRRPAPAPQKP